MLFLNKNELQPLPILLRNILMASGMNEFVEVNAFGNASVQAIKAASVFMSAIPMIIAYPFIQKYVITSYSIHYTKLYDGRSGEPSSPRGEVPPR